MFPEEEIMRLERNCKIVLRDLTNLIPYLHFRDDEKAGKDPSVNRSLTRRSQNPNYLCVIWPKVNGHGHMDGKQFMTFLIVRKSANQALGSRVWRMKDLEKNGSEFNQSQFILFAYLLAELADSLMDCEIHPGSLSLRIDEHTHEVICECKAEGCKYSHKLPQNLDGAISKFAHEQFSPSQ